MPKKANDQKFVQTELFPSAESVRSLKWQKVLEENAVAQVALMRATYSHLAKVLRRDDLTIEEIKKKELKRDDLTIDEIKKVVESLNRASSWMKNITEALRMAEEGASAATIANARNIDYINMSEDELNEALKSFLTE